jgi:hypothetical protein
MLVSVSRRCLALGVKASRRGICAQRTMVTTNNALKLKNHTCTPTEQALYNHKWSLVSSGYRFTEFQRMTRVQSRMISNKVTPVSEADILAAGENEGIPIVGSNVSTYSV